MRQTAYRAVLRYVSDGDVRDPAGNALTNTLEPRRPQNNYNPPLDFKVELYRLDLDAPRLSHAAVNDASLTLTYSETLDASSVPAAGDFSVEVAGESVSLAESSPVAVSGQQVTLTLAGAVTPGQVVTLD